MCSSDLNKQSPPLEVSRGLSSVLQESLTRHWTYPRSSLTAHFLPLFSVSEDLQDFIVGRAGISEPTMTADPPVCEQGGGEAERAVPTFSVQAAFFCRELPALANQVEDSA